MQTEEQCYSEVAFEGIYLQEDSTCRQAGRCWPPPARSYSGERGGMRLELEVLFAERCTLEKAWEHDLRRQSAHLHEVSIRTKHTPPARILGGGVVAELVVLSAERCSSEDAYERVSRFAPIAASPALRRRASHMYFSLALIVRSTREWWFLTQGFEGSCKQQ